MSALEEEGEIEHHPEDGVHGEKHQGPLPHIHPRVVHVRQNVDTRGSAVPLIRPKHASVCVRVWVNGWVGTGKRGGGLLEYR